MSSFNCLNIPYTSFISFFASDATMTSVNAIAYSSSVPMGLIFFVSVLTFLWWLSRPRNLPPGPTAIPLIGSVPSLIWGIYRAGEPAYEYLGRTLKKIYGSVYLLDICGQLVIFINDYQSINKAFQDPVMANRPTPPGKFAERTGQHVGEFLTRHRL